MTQFKIGQAVRRFTGQNMGQYVGYEGVIEEIQPREQRDKNGDWLYFKDGTRGFSSSFELVQPVGPVVTETVTKTRIVPGVYDGVEVGETIVIPDCENPDREVHPSLEVSLVGVYQADELDAAAAVLSALAKGLRDA